MTARCGGGTSSGRDAYGRFVYMGPAQIGAALNNVSTPWAILFAGALGSITYDLSTFCTTDPPADPGMTGEDWAALLNPYTLSSAVVARSKFRDFLGHYLWDTLCKCDSGTVPTPFTPPTAPTNLPKVNTPTLAPTYPTGGPCTTYQWPVDTVGDGTVHTIASFDLPTGWTSADFRAEFTDMASGSPDNARILLLYTDPSGGLWSGAELGHASLAATNAHQVTELNLHDYRHVQVRSTSSSGQPSRHFTVHFDIDCAGTTATGGPVPQPCPTDPFAQMVLDQILQLVTLIQRQAAPFAYVFGPAHSGLTGSGHIAVSGLLGARVVLDTYGAGVGTESGDPDEFFDAGWITWGNADGSTKREWITHSPFVSLPALAGQYTRIGYTLRSGVSATITEVLREP